jgi:hypothetical protein
VFESDLGAVRARVAADHGDNLPGLRLRIHQAQESCDIGDQGLEGYVDLVFNESVDTRLPVQ